MKWTLDPSHSSIEFTVKHMALTSVKGRFTDFSGEGRTDTTGALTWFKVVINAASLNTTEEQRDAHLRSADFFDVEKYPQIVFESSQLKQLSLGRFEVTGQLDMHGVKKSLTFNLNITNPVRGMSGEVRVGGETQGILKRKDWGLTWNQILEFGSVLVGEEVWFNISVQAVPESTPNYRVRWALTAGEDKFQVAMRYGRLRVQGELQGVSVVGWM